MTLLFGLFFAVILYPIAVAIMERRRLRKKTRTIFVFFSAFPIIGGSLQLLFYGTSFIWPSVTLSVVFIYLFLETQKEIRDYLTGLLNRQQIDEYLFARIREYDRKGAFTLIMMDMDGFKTINDVYGHGEGDYALVKTASILSETVRGVDRVARFGGDEFMVLLEETEREETEAVIGRIRERIDRVNAMNATPYTIALSAGYAVYDPGGYPDYAAFIRHVDDRMYRDKKRRKGRRPAPAAEETGADRRAPASRKSG